MKNREWCWPCAAFGAGLVLWVAAWSGKLPPSWWLAPWALSLVCFGLPHGALDHEVILRLWQPAIPPRRALRVVLFEYTAACGLVIAAWFAVPRAVFAGFIALTWAHWGLADLWWSWQRDPGYFTSRWHKAVFAAWRGALPMLIPLAADPGLYRQTAAVVCNLFLRQPAEFRWLELGPVRLAALGGALLLGAADFALARREARTRWLNTAEGLALLLFFSVLPALVSVGFYFAFWHGLRHIRRLMAWERIGWDGFAWQALPATVGALLMLGALPLALRHVGGGLESIGVYLALIAALTFPHAWVVTWLDLREGLWAAT